ncbi:hypothetical protein CNMCM5793_006207 [Aspergillus hiratsukae]|uniref:Kinesin light chain n=1 Tax=Aspergillus hiratsukae TaxID=1194566 RepID=A0A8H6UGU6_9EURO|nr:hypothetical protein CNMCM5793_006207 [Aspergillus hiratsukae]
MADLSFIKRSPTGDSFWATHPVIQVLARRRVVAAEETEYIRCAVSLVSAAVPRSYEEHFWKKARRLEPHAEQCWSHLIDGKWGSKEPDFSELNSIARLFRQVGRWEKAARLNRIIELGVKAQLRNESRMEFLAGVLNDLGLVYSSQRKFNNALQKYNESLLLRRQLGAPPIDDSSMTTAYNIAVVHILMGNRGEALPRLYEVESYFAEHTTDEQGLMGKESKALYLRIQNDIGEVLLKEGYVTDATHLFNKMKSHAEILGDSHPITVSIKMNLGRAHTQLHDFPTAEVLFREVITKYTEWWGRRRPETMRAVSELAVTFIERAKSETGAGRSGKSPLQKAENLLVEALGFYTDTYGPDSDPVGT